MEDDKTTYRTEEVDDEPLLAVEYGDVSFWESEVSSETSDLIGITEE